MAPTKVFVIFNDEEFKKEDILKIIKEEQYPHAFYFGDPVKYIRDEADLIDADEVWCFGKCNSLMAYHKAVKFKSDIWQMG